MRTTPNLIVSEEPVKGGTKSGHIGTLIRSASAERLRSELEKCEVVCANCHRRRTSLQFDWWRATL